MTDHSPPEKHAAVARVKTGRSFSIVWIVPIVPPELLRLLLGCAMDAELRRSGARYRSRNTE